jgi:hypothetical protein
MPRTPITKIAKGVGVSIGYKVRSATKKDLKRTDLREVSIQKVKKEGKGEINYAPLRSRPKKMITLDFTIKVSAKIKGEYIRNLFEQGIARTMKDLKSMEQYERGNKVTVIVSGDLEGKL